MDINRKKEQRSQLHSVAIVNCYLKPEGTRETIITETKERILYKKKAWKEAIIFDWKWKLEGVKHGKKKKKKKKMWSIFHMILISWRVFLFVCFGFGFLDFYNSLFEPTLMRIAGSKISNALENKSFVVSFMHLKLLRECKQDGMKVREQVGNRITG